MTIGEAAAILNREHHNGESTYEVERFPDGTRIVADGLAQYRYTEFEAIAIAEAYERQPVTSVDDLKERWKRGLHR